MMAKFCSEHFLVSWDKKGLPKDLEKLHNMCCLLTVSHSYWLLLLVMSCMYASFLCSNKK